jgi:hypothetical protein
MVTKSRVGKDCSDLTEAEVDRDEPHTGPPHHSVDLDHHDMSSLFADPPPGIGRERTRIGGNTYDISSGSENPQGVSQTGKSKP